MMEAEYFQQWISLSSPNLSSLYAIYYKECYLAAYSSIHVEAISEKLWKFTVLLHNFSPHLTMEGKRIN